MSGGRLVSCDMADEVGGWGRELMSGGGEGVHGVSLGQLVRQPIQSFIQSHACSRCSTLDVPLFVP